MEESRIERGEEEPLCDDRPGLLQRLHRDWLEIIAAVLLALATIASAWCAYQASRWRSFEAERFNEANAARIQAAEAADLADQDLGIDADMFTQYIEAYSQGDQEGMLYFETFLFRDEMKVAVEAWKEADPFSNPDAPEVPFDMPEYTNRHREESEMLELEGQVKTELARQALRHADNYILLTVLFASVLFFAGICTKFKAPGLRLAVLLMGLVLFAGSVLVLFFQPLP
jgi:hypothetical protein